MHIDGFKCTLVVSFVEEGSGMLKMMNAHAKTKEIITFLRTIFKKPIFITVNSSILSKEVN